VRAFTRIIRLTGRGASGGYIADGIMIACHLISLLILFVYEVRLVWRRV
jgi:hypothetical protein